MIVYRPDIDGLRAVAVVPVVLYHAGLPWFPGGFVGVDVFFVISGYLITKILARELEQGHFSIADFYERRARRILPALLGMLGATMAAGYFVSSPFHFEELAKSAIATLVFASNLWFWRKPDDYFSPSTEFEPLLHTWSLAVEEQFYIVFPLVLWLLFVRARAWVVPVCLGLCVLSFALSAVGVFMAESLTFYMAPTRAWELGLGVLLALGVGSRTAPAPLREAIAWAGLGGILLAVCLYSSAMAFPGMAALLPAGGAAALIWAGGQGGTFVGRCLSLGPVVFVGLISYSLYLWHWPLMALVRQSQGSAELGFLTAVAAVIGSVTLATLSWRFVEQPFRRRPPTGLGPRAIAGLSVASVAVAGAVAAVVWQEEGLPDRMPEPARIAYAGNADVSPDYFYCMGKDFDDGLCPLGGANGSDVLLWGDSHAGAIRPGLDAAMQRAGMTGQSTFKADCAPLLGVERIDLDPQRDCAGYNAKVMAMLEATDRFPTVVLSARWALTAEGDRPRKESGSPPVLARADETAPPLDSSRNFELFRESLLETVARIRATGRRVVIVDTIPEIGWTVPKVVGLAVRFDLELPRTPTLAEVKARNARVDALFSELAAHDPDIFRLEIAPLVCRPDCAVAEGHRPLYYDDDHLSRLGALRFVEPLFEPDVLSP